ncbi:hypothetical protein [Poritiphilus flavus]|uniref:Lipoprotein n=1 Tax=Poritiphilus flavus TaxID=2697053 RepID=A0A6L9EGV0_9FLAO|nr:hypothetical protein [Poritiphilus flavus]NAS13489.1 hypothetical protein [Poritiphilus flavus]
MRKVLFFLLALTVLVSCNNDDDGIALNEGNFLIFGHFYGECIGEGCVETFKLTGSKLYEDTVDDYSGRETNFVELDNAVFEQVRDLADFFPDRLLNSEEQFFGCPDCADGGGLMIQYSGMGVKRTWRIDQAKDNVPVYLHGFIDKVNEKIALINN